MRLQSLGQICLILFCCSCSARTPVLTAPAEGPVRLTRNSSKFRRGLSPISRRFGFTDPPSVPAPLATELGLAVLPGVEPLPGSDAKYADAYLKHFTGKGRPFVQEALGRRGDQTAMIESIFRRYGLPLELINVAHIESRFRPTARSTDGDSLGLWQFGKTTARAYGLEVGFWNDERKDVGKSTDAAARLFADLYRRFGDWYLAVAAYNSGPNKVGRAIEQAGTRNVFELAERGLICRTTRDFVAKFAALNEVMHAPEAYGFYLPDVVPNEYAQREN